MNRRKEMQECVRAVLEEVGIAKPWRFSMANNAHQVVEFVHHGIAVKYQFPGTPSDRRGLLNAQSGLRKRLRTTERLAVSGDAVLRPVLDAGGVQPRQFNNVGAGRAGLVENLTQAWLRHFPIPGTPPKSARDT